MSGCGCQTAAPVAQASVGRQARSRVAAQVVQSHHFAVVALCLAVQCQQGVCGSERRIQIARRLTAGDLKPGGAQPTFMPGCALP